MKQSTRLPRPTRAPAIDPVADRRLSAASADCRSSCFVPLLLSGRTDLVHHRRRRAGVDRDADQHAALHGVVSARLSQPRDDPAAQVGVDLRAGRSCSSTSCSRSGRRSRRRFSSIILVSVSSAYLAWHYTGQVWGMMASYAYLDGRRFEKTSGR